MQVMSCHFRQYDCRSGASFLLVNGHGISTLDLRQGNGDKALQRIEQWSNKMLTGRAPFPEIWDFEIFYQCFVSCRKSDAVIHSVMYSSILFMDIIHVYRLYSVDFEEQNRRVFLRFCRIERFEWKGCTATEQNNAPPSAPPGNFRCRSVLLGLGLTPKYSLHRYSRVLYLLHFCEYKHLTQRYTTYNIQHKTYNIQHTTSNIKQTTDNRQQTTYSIQYTI